jgi:sulfofructose kinase
MRFDILGVGHAAYDTFGVVDRMPDVDTACWLEAMETQGGGAASQAVVAASRLGMRAAFAGAVGDDQAGRFLVEDFLREGVDIEALAVVRGAETSKAFVIVEKSTGRRTIFVHAGTLPEPRLDDRTRRAIADSRCLHLDATSFALAEDCADFARRSGVLVSLDGCELEDDLDTTARLVGKTDILIANERYPGLLTGLEGDEALLALASMGPRIVLSTRGKEGCRLVEGGKVIAYPAYRVEAVDTTGAGDVFHGAFLTAFLRGLSMDETIRFASACSAINCLTLGGRKGIPRMDRVAEFVASEIFE